MTDIPKVGFLCAGKNPLSLSVSVHCTHKLTELFRENGFYSGGYYTVLTEPCTSLVTKRTTEKLLHLCNSCELVITVGCEGFGASDIIPDITEGICSKKTEYFTGILCGAKSFLSASCVDTEASLNTPDSPLPSRAFSGIREACMIINLSNDLYSATAIAASLMPAISFAVYNLSGKSASYTVMYERNLKSSPKIQEVLTKSVIVNNQFINNLH